MINDKINDYKKAILDIIKDNKYVTIEELSGLIDKSYPTIYRHLKKLIDNNKLKRIGSRKSGYWKII